MQAQAHVRRSAPGAFGVRLGNAAGLRLRRTASTWAGLVVTVGLVSLHSNPAVAAPYDSIRIETASGGNAPGLGSMTLTAGDTLRVWAAAYDHYGDFWGQVDVDWVAAPSIATLDVAHGPTSLVHTSETGVFRVRANVPSIDPAWSGDLIVVPTTPAQLVVVALPAATAPPLAAIATSADTTLVLYARSQDLFGNDIGSINATWWLDAPLGSLTPGSGPLTVFEPEHAGTTILHVASPGFARLDLSLQVLPGRLAALRIVAPPATSAVGDTVLASGASLGLAALGFDADGNALGQRPVLWSTTGSSLELTPSSGPTTTARGKDLGTARVVATAGNVQSSSGTIRTVAGPLFRLRISRSPDALAPLLSTTLDADQFLQLFALGEDAYGHLLGPVPATWTSTDPNVASVTSFVGLFAWVDPAQVGSARIVAERQGATSDTTGTLTVIPGAPASIRIETRPNGKGTEIGAVSLSCDSTLALHAVRRDADGNFIAASNASWSIAGDVGALSPAQGPSVVLDARRPGTGRVTAVDLLFTDATGAIEVVPGAAHALRLEDATGMPVESRLLKPGEMLALRAALLDADANELGTQPSTWSWQGDVLATPPAAPARTFEWTAGRAGRGRLVIAAANVLADSSGWITVATGALSRIEVQDDRGVPIADRSLATDSILVLHAVAFDTGGNALGDVAATWSLESSGGAGLLEPASGSSTVLHPNRIGSVSILARHSSGAEDRTGVIGIVPGTATRVVIEDRPDGSGTHVGSRSFVAGESLLLYAVGRDVRDNAVGPVECSWNVGGGIGRLASSFGSSSLFTAERTGSGDVGITNAPVAGERTGSFQVTPAAPANLRIERTPGDPFDPIDAATLAAGDSLPACAVLRDAFGNFIAGPAAEWSLAGDPNATTLSRSGPASSLFVRGQHPGTAILKSTWTSFASQSGPIEVRAGNLARVAIETAPDGSGTAFGPRSLAAGNAVSMYAVGRDARGNVVGPVVVAWDAMGGIGRVETTVGTSTRFLAEHPGIGFVRATPTGLGASQSGDLTVTPGPAAALSIELGPGAPSDPLPAMELTTDDSLEVFAVLRDAYGNLAGQAPVSWSLGGDPTAALLVPFASNAAALRLLPRRVATVTVRAAASGLQAESPGLRFLPGLPVGTIPVAAAPDTLRAGNPQGSHLAVGPIGDRFGNPVADGTRVDLMTSLGSFSGDANPTLPGSQQLTHGGRVEITLAAPATPGTARVDVASGGAHGGAAVVFLPPVRLSIVPDSFAPMRVQRGTPFAPGLRVRNEDSDGLQISSARIRFQDGNGVQYESSLAQPISIAARAEGWLEFQSVLVPATLAPGSYAPGLELAGMDSRSEPFAATLALPVSSLRVDQGAAAHVTARSPARLTRGEPVRFELEVLNAGDVAAQLNAARTTLACAAAGFATSLDLASDTLLGPGETAHLRFLPATWPLGSSAGSASLSLSLFGSSGSVEYAETLAMETVQVEIPGVLEPIAASLEPSQVPLGAAPELRIRLRNAGGSTVRLDAATQLSLAAHTAALATPVVLRPDSIAELAFAPLGLDGVAPGRHPLGLAARGSQNGAAFASDLGLPDSLVVFAPAALAILGVHPSQPTVTRSQTEPWTIDIHVANSGQTSYRIDSAELHVVQGGIDRTASYDLVRRKVLGAPLVPAALDTLSFQVLRTGPDVGLVTLEANLRATDLATGESFDVDTYRGGKGSVRVQAPALPVPGALLLSQPAVVAGQSRAVQASLSVRNNGEAALELDTTSLAASLNTTPTLPVSVEMAPAATRLEAGDEIQLRWMLGPFDIAPGPVVLAAAPRFIEPNRQFLHTVTMAETLEVRSPASLAVAAGSAPERITAGQARAWEVRFQVTNTGGGTARLLDPGLVIRTSGLDVTAQYGVLPPVHSLDRTDLDLAAGQTATLVFGVGSTDPTPRSLDIAFRCSALELESGRSWAVPPSGACAVVAQAPPQLTAIDSTLAPRVASRGQEIAFAVRVVNTGEADLRLDPSRSRLELVGTDIGASLAPLAVLAGGASTLLGFAPLAVDVASGLYALQLQLYGTENDNPWHLQLPLGLPLLVQPASRLEIVAVRASQPIVTSAQTRPWNVRVAVRNHGAAAEFEDASLVLAIGTEDVTARFGIRAPAGFESGGTTLAAGAADTLSFDIGPTGDVEGLVTLDAELHAHDTNSGARLDVRSSGTARGSVRAAQRARPVIVAVVASQPRVSAGQSSEWTALCTVRNEGGTAWRADWSESELRIGASGDDSLVLPAVSNTASRLEPGASSEASFRVVRTGNETGDLGLVLTLSGEQESDGARIAAAGAAGTVTIQAPARAHLGSIAAALPRAPFANATAELPLVVDLANDGEAELAACSIRLVSDGAAPADTVVALAQLAGGAHADVEIGLRARPDSGPVSVHASIENATDANDLSRHDAWSEVRDARLDLVAQTRGFMQLEVFPGQARVSASQLAPWWVTLRVDNPAEEPLRLRPPRAADLEFVRAGVVQADYVVVPPDTLETGGLVLPGGARGTLRYRIVRTGVAGGAIEITSQLVADHTNEMHAPAATAAATAQLEVDAEPGLHIVSTESITWRRLHGHDDFRVLVGQAFAVRVVVENTGGTVLDSIRVQVDSQRGNTSVEPGELFSLAPGERGALDLAAVAGNLVSQPGLPETFSSYVQSARDRNTGLPVLPGAALDNTSLAYVELPAQLDLAAWIDAPEGARDGDLSVGQEFVLAARVDNHGGAEVSASGRLAIDIPPGYSLVAGETETFFVPGEILRWTLHAAEMPHAEAESLAVQLAAVPLDMDSGEPARLDRDRQAIAVRVLETGDLSAGLSLLAPTGALDGRISGGQTLDLDLRVRGDVELVEREAVVLLPPGWRDAPGQTPKQEFPPEPEAHATWSVVAGDIPGPVSIVLRITARDRNDETEHVASDTLQLDLERPSRLALGAAIVAPDEARAGRLLPGQRFRLRASLHNQGDAPAVGGSLRIAELPSGYQAEPAEQPIAFDAAGTAAVEWEITSPGAWRDGPEVVRIAFGALPVDANSGQAAGLDPDSTNARVVVSLANDGVAIATTPLAARLAAPGERRVPLLVVDLTNGSAAEVSVDSLGIASIVSGDPFPDALLSGLQLVREDAPAETLFVAVASPVAWMGLGNAPMGRLAAGKSARFTLLGDLAAALSPVSLTVSLRMPRTGDVLVRAAQSGSRTPLPVRAAPQSSLESAPIRVLAAAMQAYNAPNPFHVGRETTMIRYQIDTSTEVQVRIATLAGDLVWEALRQEATNGPALRGIAWDGRNGSGQPVRNGVYMCHVQVGARSSRFKIAVVR